MSTQSNKEFIELAESAMKRLNVGKTEFAERHLEIDPKTFLSYRKGLVKVPTKIQLKVLSLATGQTEQIVKNMFDDLFGALKKRLMKAPAEQQQNEGA